MLHAGASKVVESELAASEVDWLSDWLEASVAPLPAAESLIAEPPEPADPSSPEPLEPPAPPLF